MPQRHALLGSTSRRWMLVPLALSAPACYATFFENTTDSPVFHSIIDVAPGPVWGAGWLVISALALFTLRFGSAWSYRATNTSMIFMSTMWGGSTFSAKFVQGIPVTSAALGLWAFVVAASLFAVFMPFAVARPESK